MTTGEIIKNARKEWKWSQERLAKEVGISRYALSQIENGKELNMNARTAVKIANVLGLTLDFLLCRVR